MTRDFSKATQFALRNSQWMHATYFAELIAKHSNSGGVKVEKLMRDHLGDDDFHWPWFNDWIDGLRATGDCTEQWAEFLDDGNSENIDILRALGSVTKPHLVALAKTHGVGVKSSDKVKVMRVILSERLPDDAAALLIASQISVNKKCMERDRRKHKRMLLISVVNRLAYATGRLAQLREGGFPFWVYGGYDIDSHHCPLHAAWNGMVIPADAPWWKTHYPPNGFGCHCYVSGASSIEAARRLGGDPEKKPDPAWLKKDPKTGTPAGVDKGWDSML